MWGFLSPAVLLHEAEGEFAAVGGGDGEEVGGRGTAGEVEGVLVRTRWGEHHLFAAALHVGEPGGDHAVVRLQCASAHLHVVALVVGIVTAFVLREGCPWAGVEHHVHVAGVARVRAMVWQWRCEGNLGKVDGHPAACGVGVCLGLSVRADSGDADVAHVEEALHRLGGEILVVALLRGGEPCVAVSHKVQRVSMDIGDGAVATGV